MTIPGMQESPSPSFYGEVVNDPRANGSGMSAASARPVWSLFSGAMGLDLGLEESGLTADIAIEIDKWCCETIRANRPGTSVLEEDITGMAASDIKRELGTRRNPFLIAGGPPCQSFSPGGKRAGLSDPRGNLIYEFFRIVAEAQPEFFLFENVANLVTAALRHRPIASRPGKHWSLKAYENNRSLKKDDAPPMEDDELSGSAIRALMRDVHEVGYQISFGVLDAADFGAPQHRLRFVMLGSRRGNPLSLPDCCHGDDQSGLRPFMTLKEAIADLRDNPGPHSEYSDYFKDVYDLVPPGGNWRDLPEDVQREAMGGSFAAGGGKTGFFRRLSWDAPAPTITGKSNRKGSGICHPEFTRPLSVRECARVQGFPDTWEFTGAMNQQYQQVGNAVPVYLGQALGVVIAARKRTRPAPSDQMLDAAVRRLRRSARNKVSRGKKPLDQLTFG